MLIARKCTSVHFAAVNRLLFVILLWCHHENILLITKKYSYKSLNVLEFIQMFFQRCSTPQSMPWLI